MNASSFRLPLDQLQLRCHAETNESFCTMNCCENRRVGCHVEGSMTSSCFSLPHSFKSLFHLNRHALERRNSVITDEISRERMPCVFHMLDIEVEFPWVTNPQTFERGVMSELCVIGGEFLRDVKGYTSELSTMGTTFWVEGVTASNDREDHSCIICRLRHRYKCSTDANVASGTTTARIVRPGNLCFNP